MSLDAGGVTAALEVACPLDGVSGPLTSAGTCLYPDGNGAYWRLTFDPSATSGQQQSAIAALSTLTANPPPPPTLTPYRLAGSVVFGATLAVGMTTMSLPVSGLLRTDNPMVAFGTALPSGVDVKAEYPDPSQDGVLVLQVSVLQALASSTTVPFTLIGVR